MPRLLVRLLPTALMVAASVAPLGAHAHEGHDDPTPYAPAEQYAPTPIPDRIILTWTGDPAHTQDVTWRTDTSVQHAVAELAVADGGPYFPATADRVEATTESFTSDLSDAHYHSAHFEGLAPGVKYAYRVGDGVNWSEWFHFTTASEGAAPFSFVYFGDAQNDLRSMWSRVIREAHGDAPDAAFLLHAGDLVNSSNADAEWGEWHGAGAWLNAMTPSVATPGNHEFRGGELSRHWRPTFALPTNGPEGLEETVYYLDYQGVRIISLNSNERRDEQTPWLDEVLTNNPHRWAIVAFHHPVYSSGKNRDNPELRAAWKPIFDKHRVDLVLQGHDHTYARSGLNVPENVSDGVNMRDAAGGTVYVVSVSGPKMYDLQRGEFVQRAASGTQLYQIIHIDGDRLDYEARTAVGEIYDAFTLRKQPGKINRLIERVPETPERRKPAS